MRVLQIVVLATLPMLLCVGCKSMWDLTCPTTTPRNGGTIEDARLEIVQLSGDLRGAERQRAYAVNHTHFAETSPKIVRLDAAITAAQMTEAETYTLLADWDAGQLYEPERYWREDRLRWRRQVADAVRASQRTMVAPDRRWDGQPTWSIWRWLRTGNGQGTIVKSHGGQ